MTDAAIAQIVTGCVTIALAAISAYFANRAKSQSEANAKAVATNTEVTNETHKLVNSKMEEFKKLAELYFQAKGVLQEKADEQSRKDIIASATPPVPDKATEVIVVNPPSDPVPTIIHKP